MKLGVQRAIGFIVVAVLTFPVAVLATFLTSAFWGWVEARTGIESLGHSGPADWCFFTVYGLMLTVEFVAWRVAGRDARQRT